MTKNIRYITMCKNSNMTFKDFIKICDHLELPVFSVTWTINPFAEPHKERSAKMYSDMSEYRKTMPEWSARNYDYKNDRALGYYKIDIMAEGDFLISADNSFSSYEWRFRVFEDCVLVDHLSIIRD